MNYTRNNISIVITHFPDRKKPVLAILEGNRITKVASFNDEESAEWFMERFEEWIGGVHENQISV